MSNRAKGNRKFDEFLEKEIVTQQRYDSLYDGQTENQEQAE